MSDEETREETIDREFREAATAAAAMNGLPSGIVGEHPADTIELDLRERLVVLEEWRARAEPAIGLLLLAGIGLGVIVLLLHNKRQLQ